MKLKVKQKFLSYNIGEELPISLLSNNPKYFTAQVNNGNLEVIKEQHELTDLIGQIKKPTLLKRVKEYAEDLLDDGKRNFSNNPNKKSPGRKKSKK